MCGGSLLRAHLLTSRLVAPCFTSLNFGLPGSLAGCSLEGPSEDGHVHEDAPTVSRAECHVSAAGKKWGPAQEPSASTVATLAGAPSLLEINKVRRPATQARYNSPSSSSSRTSR